MSVYRLPVLPLFPPADHAEPDGLVAVGGDLSVPRLLTAYASGIFPWPVDDGELLWFSPDPRFVLYLDEFHMPRSLKKTLRSGLLRFTIDAAFADVVRNCATAPRGRSRGTWITNQMAQGYIDFHKAGFAHSVEVWRGEDLVGGLYGVSIGRFFSGESMFTVAPDGSKAALAVLVSFLRESGVTWIDCQMETDHLARFGGRSVARSRFLDELGDAVTQDAVDWRRSLRNPLSAV